MSITRTIMLTACVLAPLASVEIASDPPVPAAAASTTIGRITLSDIPITVKRLGDLTPGKPLTLELVLPADVSAPSSLSVWVSSLSDPTAAAETLDKVRALDDTGGHWTAKLTLPAKLDKINLWISVTRGTGSPTTGSLPLQ